jgi:hypothetical protein
VKIGAKVDRLGRQVVFRMAEVVMPRMLTSPRQYWLRPHRSGRKTPRTRLLAKQPVHAFAHEPLLPAPDAGIARSRLTPDLVGSDTLRKQEGDARWPYMLLRSAQIDSRRTRSAAFNSKVIPVRITQIRTATRPRESIKGFIPQILSTSRGDGFRSSGSTSALYLD